MSDYILQDRGYTSPCWIWQKRVDHEGYGRVWRKEYKGTAHKWYYVVNVGPVAQGVQLDHLCNNRACVNPDHLEPVSAAVNVQRSSKTKLTYAQVKEIRLLYATGDWLQRELGKEYGVSRSAIKHIVTGDGWR